MVRPSQIDVLPIRSDGEGIAVTAESRVAAPAGELQARRQALRELGLDEGDAALPSGCVSSEYPNPSAAQRAGCPSTRRTIAAVSLPRLGDLTTDSVFTGSSAQRWSVRVIIEEIGPDGWSSRSGYFVLQQRDDTWRVIKKGVFVIAE